MSIIESIETLKFERSILLSFIKDLSDEQLIKIPERFSNNILWNIGHIIATQQSLHYTLSRVETRVSKDFQSIFIKGSDPKEWNEIPDIENIKLLLFSLPDQFIEDYKSGIFKEFKPYKTSAGFEINNLEDALKFNLYHEGIHTGIILSLKKFV